MSQTPPTPTEVTRSGFVALIGRPNAGKSTLANQIVDSHVAIVSPKPQTTRRPIRVILTRGNTQIVLCDLPGTQRPMDRLTSRMQGHVESTLKDVDAALWVVDVTAEPKGGERSVAQLIARRSVPTVVVLNKIDLVKPHIIAARLTQLNELSEGRFAAMIPVSAATGDGVERVVDELAGLMPPGPAYYPPGELTDLRLGERISEHVREAALHHLRDELPHATMVQVEELEQDGNLLRAQCTIWVERQSQVGIVVGAQGATIKAIGTDARHVLESVLGGKVFLSLQAKVRQGWRQDDSQLSRWGH